MKTLYLYATFARSLDNYHNKYGFTHLISSVFYYDRLLCNYPFLVKYSNVKYHYILNISPLDSASLEYLFSEDLPKISPKAPIVKISDDKVVVFEMSILWLYITYANSGYYNADKFDEFLLDVFTRLGPANNELTSKNVFKNTLFVFKSTNWINLQIIFRAMKVHLSGGSTSRRQLLSTSEFNLSKFLFLLGCSDHQVYNSSILHKDANDSNGDFHKMQTMKVPKLFYFLNYLLEQKLTK